MKNAHENALDFVNGRKELDTVTYMRQQNELNSKFNILVQMIVTLKKLKTINNLNRDVSPPSVSAEDAQTARDLYDDLLDQIKYSFEHDILKSPIHYNPYRNDF